jgi:DNA-binding response OmpR family regulator
MSGYTDEMIGTRNGGLDAGTQYLQKPFTFEALLRKVRDVLDEGVAPGVLVGSGSQGATPATTRPGTD